MATVYLRIGHWHASETSRDYARGTVEAGVSVYDLDANGQPIAPDGEWTEDDLRDRLKSAEPKLLVEGDLVGEGGDGEPLLKNLKIVGEWSQLK